MKNASLQSILKYQKEKKEINISSERNDDVVTGILFLSSVPCLYMRKSNDYMLDWIFGEM